MRVVGFAERRGRSVRPPGPLSTVSGPAGIVVGSSAVAPSRDPSGSISDWQIFIKVWPFDLSFDQLLFTINLNLGVDF